MLTSLYAKLIGAGLILALLAGGALYFHHMGYETGRASQAALIVSQSQQIAADAVTLRQVNADAAAAKADAANQKAYADAAIAAVKADGAIRMRDAQEWQRKLAAAERSKGCGAQLAANLCSAIKSY